MRTPFAASGGGLGPRSPFARRRSGVRIPDPVTFVGAGSSDTTTIAMPEGIQAGDLAIVQAANRQNGNNIPSLPSGWTNIGTLINTAGFTNFAQRWGYRILGGEESNVGTWSNAERMVCTVLRGVDQLDPIVAFARRGFSSSQQIVIPGVDLEGEFALVASLVLIRNNLFTNDQGGAAPAGMVLRHSHENEFLRVEKAALDTGEPLVTTWSDTPAGSGALGVSSDTTKVTSSIGVRPA